MLDEEDDSEAESVSEPVSGLFREAEVELDRVEMASSVSISGEAGESVWAALMAAMIESSILAPN